MTLQKDTYPTYADAGVLMTNDDHPRVLHQIDNDDSPMKKWLDEQGFFRNAEDNFEAWRVHWVTYDGSSYVFRGHRDDDPVMTTFNSIKQILWDMCL